MNYLWSISDDWWIRSWFWIRLNMTRWTSFAQFELIRQNKWHASTVKTICIADGLSLYSHFSPLAHSAPVHRLTYRQYANMTIRWHDVSLLMLALFQSWIHFSLVILYTLQIACNFQLRKWTKKSQLITVVLHFSYFIIFLLHNSNCTSSKLEFNKKKFYWTTHCAVVQCAPIPHFL